jgi:hypothetical protein
MQSLARTAAPVFRQNLRRGFATTAARGQAVPTEKPVVMKEFKIYRWVSFDIIENYAKRGLEVGAYDQSWSASGYTSIPSRHMRSGHSLTIPHSEPGRTIRKAGTSVLQD